MLTRNSPIIVKPIRFKSATFPFACHKVLDCTSPQSLYKAQPTVQQGTVQYSAMQYSTARCTMRVQRHSQHWMVTSIPQYLHQQLCLDTAAGLMLTGSATRCAQRINLINKDDAR